MVKEEPEISPERERELVFNSMPRRYRRRAKKQRQPKFELPDLLRGMSNHQRMMVKKIARAGQETSSRKRRSKQ